MVKHHGRRSERPVYQKAGPVNHNVHSAAVTLGREGGLRTQALARRKLGKIAKSHHRDYKVDRVTFKGTKGERRAHNRQARDENAEIKAFNSSPVGAGQPERTASREAKLARRQARMIAEGHQGYNKYLKSQTKAAKSHTARNKIVAPSTRVTRSHKG